jgi:hypothetical protein
VILRRERVISLRAAMRRDCGGEKSRGMSGRKADQCADWMDVLPWFWWAGLATRYTDAGRGNGGPVAIVKRRARAPSMIAKARWSAESRMMVFRA